MSVGFEVEEAFQFCCVDEIAVGRKADAVWTIDLSSLVRQEYNQTKGSGLLRRKVALPRWRLYLHYLLRLRSWGLGL